MFHVPLATINFDYHLYPKKYHEVVICFCQKRMLVLICFDLGDIFPPPPSVVKASY